MLGRKGRSVGREQSFSPQGAGDRRDTRKSPEYKERMVQSKKRSGKEKERITKKKIDPNKDNKKKARKERSGGETKVRFIKITMED